MKILLFFVTLILVNIVGKFSAEAKLLGGWELNHCNYSNEIDRVSFQIFLPLRNKHLLADSSSYEPSEEINKKYESEERIHRRLAQARSVFFPLEEEFQKVETFLFSEKNVPKNLCERKSKDSIICSNVPPKTVESLFENKISLCYYTHPRKQNNHKNYLLTEIAPIFTAGGYFDNGDHRAFVSGLSLHAFPTHFGQQAQSRPKVSSTSPQQQSPSSLFNKNQQKNNNNNNNQKRSAKSQSAGIEVDDFPIGNSSDPVIVRIQELEYLGPSGAVSSIGLLSVIVALNCFDGTAGSYNGAAGAFSPVTCSGGASLAPTSASVKVHDEAGGNVQQGTYYINSFNAKVSCSSAGTQFGQAVSAAVQNAVVCQLDTRGDIVNLVPFQRYVISVTVQFGTLGKSNESPFRNYYFGKFQSYPSASPPSGVTNSIVTPIVSLASYPSDIQKKYGIDVGESVSLMQPAVSQGVFEFAQIDEPNPNGGYNAADVVTYMKQINNGNFDNLPIHYVGTSNFAYLDASESALDIEIIMALGMNAPTVFWTVSLGPSNADFTSFLAACTNLFAALATNETSTDFPRDIPFPTSWSISYGLPEQDAVQENSDMVTRSDAYLQILSNVGVHVYVSSGDSGATDNDGVAAMAHFPAVLPHAVAVGATAFHRPVGSTAINEVACSALDQNIITSGGAISAFFNQPSYQQPYVSQNYRGIPDVAALGANIFAIVNGNSAEMYGTSAAAPIFAGIMTLVNNRLALQGKDALSNAHNFFYSSLSSSGSNNKIFVDVTSGNNCGTRANNNQVPVNFPTLWIGNCFFAASGWDAVTGVGTPRFDNIIKQLTGETVAPNTFAPGANGGSGSGSGNSGGSDASSAMNFVEKHWAYFAIGGGVFLFLLFVCCAVLKKRSLDAARREEVLGTEAWSGGAAAGSISVAASRGRSPRSARNNQRMDATAFGGYGSVQQHEYNGSLSSRNGAGTRYDNI